MKLNKKTVSAAIVASLLVLIFLSGTIYNFSLTAVTAVRPVRGHLNHSELTSGVVRHAELVEVYAHIAGWADSVIVREGDFVYEGQTVIRLDFRGQDTDISGQIEAAEIHLQEQLANLELNRNRTQLDITRLNANIENLQRQREELVNETLRQDTVSDFELLRSLRDIETAEEALARVQLLYNEGIATRHELRTSEESLQNLRIVHENIQRVYRENHERNQVQREDWQTSRERQLRDLQHQTETLERDRQARNLDMEAFRLQETTMRRDFETRVADYEGRREDFANFAEITAPVDGIVTFMPISQGQHISANQLLGIFGTANAFVVECEIPISNNFVSPGSGALMYNAAHTLRGIVMQVVPLEHTKRVYIAIESDRVGAGETFTIQFEETSADTFVLVPNGAINRDNDGYFVNQIRRRRGILGDEFYAERLGVMIGDADNDNTAIIRGITFFEPIVLYGTAPFSHGETLRLRNEGDLFEN